ncbi:hypothetical protein [Vreelandella massiliensis]|uniref:hypothetical protein n=1 Tax=Vreelandella massiliensis TaxID=1816686 RepID=UPI00096A7478|nr:hypothetical protein [Halomonas massiliensis]
MGKTRRWLCVALALVPMMAQAGPGPFGLSVGETTLEEARTELSGKTSLQSKGINKWSNGPMIASAGTGLGLDGLQEALFIFDQDNTLTSVVLSLHKNRYNDLRQMLANQYPMVGEQAPFVGNKVATFREDGVTIEANAPHMSFTMTLSYHSEDFSRQYQLGMEQQRQEKAQRESSQL